MTDTYNTIEKIVEEVLYKEKNSKFIGYAFPLNDENDCKLIIDSLKKIHPKAVHFCYAYKIEKKTPYYRTNDDGEPNHSAGTPILGQIESFNLTNILVVVVRYFGGIKLGVSGLIIAYKTTAKMTLEQAKHIEKTKNKTYIFSLTYQKIDTFLKKIKLFNAQIIEQKLENTCTYKIAIREKNASAFLKAIADLVINSEEEF